MTDHTLRPGDDKQENLAIDDPLSREEDDELRRLNFMAQNGALSERSEARMMELRLRDRRRTVRPPRELEIATERVRQSTQWSRFLDPSPD